MLQKNKIIFLMGSFFLTFAFVNNLFSQEGEDYKILQEIVQNEFGKESPAEQGTELGSVLHRFKTSEKKVALMLGACLDQGVDIDTALFQGLQSKQISASLFLDQGWLNKNSAQLKPILAPGKILLENHGLFCRPLSVTGKGIQNHPGTDSVSAAFEEIEKNSRIIESFSGRLPRFFKSGYGFYDDVSLKIVAVLGYAAVEGDLKLRAKDVETDESLNVFLDKLQPGSMIVIPANRPGTTQLWLPKLLDGISKRGYQIAALDDVINAEEENH